MCELVKFFLGKWWPPSSSEGTVSTLCSSRTVTGGAIVWISVPKGPSVALLGGGGISIMGPSGRFSGDWGYIEGDIGDPRLFLFLFFFFLSWP